MSTPTHRGGGSTADRLRRGRPVFPVVGIGASAGGLKALLTLLRAHALGLGHGVRRGHPPVAHARVEHRRILRRRTRMPVMQVTRVGAHRARPRLRHPAQQAPRRCSDGVLELAAVQAQGRRGDRRSTSFFRTLAATHKEHAIAIVLSGTGADGSVGIKNIKEHGGITMAQAPTDAEYDSMPRNAIGTGVVDFVLPVAQMPERLLQLWQNMQQIRLPEIAEGDPTRRACTVASYEPPLREVLNTLRQRTGHDFTQYKRATVLRRIERRLQVNQLTDLSTLRGLPARPPGRDARAAEGHADQRDQLLPRPRSVRGAGAHDRARPVRGQSPERRGARLGGRAAPPARKRIRSRCCSPSSPRSARRAPRSRSSPPTSTTTRSPSRARASTPSAIATDVSPTRLRRFFVTRSGRLPRAEGAARARAVRVAQRAARSAVLAARPRELPQPADLPQPRRAGARARRVPFRAEARSGFLFLGSSESVDEAGTAFVPVDKAQPDLPCASDTRRARHRLLYAVARR